MKDVYFVNKETGEMVPSAVAFHEYYKVQKHSYLDSIFDAYTETDIEVENSHADLSVFGLNA